jgi:hypothetical protein
MSSKEVFFTDQANAVDAYRLRADEERLEDRDTNSGGRISASRGPRKAPATRTAARRPAPLVQSEQEKRADPAVVRYHVMLARRMLNGETEGPVTTPLSEPGLEPVTWDLWGSVIAAVDDSGDVVVPPDLMLRDDYSHEDLPHAS